MVAVGHLPFPYFPYAGLCSTRQHTLAHLQRCYSPSGRTVLVNYKITRYGVTGLFQSNSIMSCTSYRGAVCWCLLALGGIKQVNCSIIGLAFQLNETETT